MTTVNSWNEWDSLKHVIVGTVDNSNVPPMEPALEPKISKGRLYEIKLYESERNYVVYKGSACESNI